MMATSDRFNLHPMKKFILLGTALLASFTSGAQRVEWVDYAYCTTQWDGGTGIATDDAGHVYALGSISAELIIQSDTFTNQYGTDDILLMKYDPQGDLVWGKVIGSPILDWSSELAVDGYGHLYAECAVQGTTMMSDTTYDAPFDHQVIQFDTAGNFLRYFSHLREIIADAQGSAVYLAYANIVEKRDTALNVLWNRTASNDHLYFSNVGPQGGRASMMVGNNGHLVLAGYENSVGGSTMFDTLLLKFSAAGYCDELCVISMDTSGSALWVRTLDSSSTYQELYPKVAVNDAGEVYLGLYSEGDTLIFGGDQLSNGPSLTPYTAWLKYDAAGTPQWAVGCLATWGADPSDIAINAQQEALICGISSGSGLLGNHPLLTNGLAVSVPYVAKLDPAGNVQWYKSSDAVASAEFNSITTCPNGDYAMTGSYPPEIGSQLPYSIGCHPSVVGSKGIMTLTLSENPEIYPTADFSATPQAPYTFSFTDLSVNATAWHWDFGDGNTSTDQNPVHTYATNGPFTVLLTAERGTCEDTASVELVNVGIEELAGAVHIGLAPNPAGAVLRITSSHAMEGIKVLDLAGRTINNIVLATRAREFELRTDGMPGGLYVLEVTAAGIKGRKTFVRAGTE